MASKAVEIEIRAKIAEAVKKFKEFSRQTTQSLKEVKDQAKDTAGGLKDAGDATGGLGKKFDALVPAAVAAAAAFAVWQGLKSVVAFLKDAGEEAANQELALTGLHTALVANKRASGDFERQVIAQAEAMQKLTGFTDDSVEAAAKILAPYENITNDLFPRTLQATADLARALGIDLPSAAQMMGMASLGMTRGLKQIGLDIDQAEFKSIGFAGVLTQLESKIKGQADAYRTTSKGLSDYIKTMWGEVKEQFGAVVNQVLKPFQDATGRVLAYLADKLAEWTKGVDLKTWAETAAKNLENFVKYVIDEALPKLQAFTEQIERTLKAVPATFDDIKARATAFIDVLKVVIDAFVLFWKVSTGRGYKTLVAGEFQKTYDELVKAIDSVKGINKDVADDVKNTPIEPQADITQPKQSFEELYAWYQQEKTRIESQPIRIRIIRETIVSGEGTTTEYGYQSGGLIPGPPGGGDRVPIMAERGEFMMRKEAVW